MSWRWMLALGLACAWGGWQSWKYRELHRPPGVLVRAEPLQGELEGPQGPFRVGRYSVQPQASYRIDARLLSRERYRLDSGADLAPLDFAVGWGPMSDTAVLEALRISQSNRYFRLRWDQPPIPEDQMMTNASNMHLIAADAGVERRLDSMRAGQIIRLEGQLVRATRDDGWSWNTSLSRTDTGAGACELMWVTDARVLN